MSKVSSITSSRIDSSNSPDSNAPPLTLLCRSTDLTEAVHALYYLPEAYNLLVVDDAAQPITDRSWIDSIAFKHRIQFNKKEGAAVSTPSFPFAAIISNEQDTQYEQAATPHVVVSANATGMIQTTTGFTVQVGNPEALASAILRATRK